MNAQKPQNFIFEDDEDPPVVKSPSKGTRMRTETGVSNALRRNLFMEQDNTQQTFDIPEIVTKKSREEIVWVPGKKETKRRATMQERFHTEASVTVRSSKKTKQSNDMLFDGDDDDHQYMEMPTVNQQLSPKQKRKFYFENDFDDDLQQNIGIDMEKKEIKILEVPPEPQKQPVKPQAQVVIEKEIKNEPPQPSRATGLQESVDQSVQPQDQSLTFVRLSDISDRKQFLLNPIPKGKILQCSIKRDNSGFGVFYPQYDVYMSEECRYLMSGKKKAGGSTSSYIMSSDKNDFQTSGYNYLGKLKSNFTGTNFRVFDCGENPKQSENVRKHRKVLASIEYEPNVFGKQRPRIMKVFVPDPTNPPKINQEQSWKQEYEGNQKDKIKMMSNKQPKWNDKLKVYVLNFKGRVSRASVKNFIIVETGTEQPYILLFGRVGDDIFNMDISYPLSPLQALGIVLSSFDFKLACQ